MVDVDKLKYLRGFLEGPAKSVISGIPMTDTSYETAVNLLKGRHANPTVIQRAHIKLSGTAYCLPELRTFCPNELLFALLSCSHLWKKLLLFLKKLPPLK